MFGPEVANAPSSTFHASWGESFHIIVSEFICCKSTIKQFDPLTFLSFTSSTNTTNKMMQGKSFLFRGQVQRIIRISKNRILRSLQKSKADTDGSTCRLLNKSISISQYLNIPISQYPNISISQYLSAPLFIE